MLFPFMLFTWGTLMAIPFQAKGQTVTHISGKVADALTGEAIPFASITFPGTQVGTITGDDGSYMLETQLSIDSVSASFLGYKTVTFPVQKRKTQQINFALTADDFQISEVTVKPGENPAHIILRHIIERKDENNLSQIHTWQYEQYSKIRIDLTNIKPLTHQRILKPFDFVFENIDTIPSTGESYLPVLMSESISDCYYQDKPRKDKEVITASRISGTQNASMAQLTSRLYQKFNIYDNTINLFDVVWTGPLSDHGLFYYKYHLQDTAIFDNHVCYKIEFTPKRKQERTFKGYFWVADTSWAIAKIDMQISEDANINFIQDLTIENEYAPYHDTLWFPKQENLYVDVHLTDKTTGFIGRKSTFIREIQINNEVPEKILKNPNDLLIKEGAMKNDETFWAEQRAENLSLQEAHIYGMVDSVQKVPLYRTFAGMLQTFYTYYYVTGPIEIGPYYRFISYNPIEGYRFRFGGRTSNAFSTKLMLEGYVAYGTKDERFKYGGGILYLLNKNPRVSAGFHYESDVQQLGQSANAFLEDNFITSLLRRNPNYKLTMVEEYKAYFEKEWFQGFSNKIIFDHRSIYSTEYVPFNTEIDGNIVPAPSVVTSEIILNTRFAWQEKYLMGEFERTSLGTKWPVVNLNLTFGIPGIYNSSYRYQRINLNVSHTLELPPFGYTQYSVDGGIIWGKTPYPLLELHKGNETYAFDYMAFNLMNYYEFASDRYVSLFAEHHFDGFFFNHIPLLRRAKLREVVTFRGLMGELHSKNRSVILLPDGLESVNKGYMEAGVGVENILKVLRFDAVWRLSYLNHPDIQPFGIRFCVQLVL